MVDGLVIIGAGGFGREVLDIIEAIEATGHELGFVGFLDDGDVDEDRLARRGAILLGRTTDISRFADRYVIGVGSAPTKARLEGALCGQGVRPEVLVHPMATVGGDTHLAPGCILAAGARVTTNVELGRHVHIHVNATVGHDTRIGDFATVLPGATIGGDTTLENAVTIGTGANVLNGVSIGNNANVGAGAVVVRDVHANVTVAGVPARVLGKSAR